MSTAMLEGPPLTGVETISSGTRLLAESRDDGGSEEDITQSTKVQLQSLADKRKARTARATSNLGTNREIEDFTLKNISLRSETS